MKLLIQLALIAMTLHTTQAAPPDIAALTQQVTAAERAFVKSMADRNHAAFVSHLADETVFFGGGGGKVLRGKDAVATAWKHFYLDAKAPFSWEPDSVEVLDSGTLAHSSGLVRDPSGKLIARFNSVWRLESPGVWKIVFDNGSEVCDCKTTKGAGQ